MTRGRKPDPDELQVERVGLGYVGTLISEGIVVAFDRIVQARGEVMGELTVERAPEGHLLIAKFSASSRADREQTARDLGGRSNNVVWRDVLEQFCLRVLSEERAGEPFESVGTEPPAPELDWLLRPFLVRGEPTILFGEGDAGKSTIAAAIAVMARTGVPVIEGWQPRRPPSGVLVMDWEGQQRQWNDRIAAAARGVGIEPPQICYRRGMGTALTDQIHDVAQHLAQHKDELLIVDSVGLAEPTRSEGADANESAKRMFSALGHLRVTSLLIDHVAGVDVGADRLAAKPYGSVFKKWLARSVWQLRAGATDPDGTMHVALYHDKFNAGEKHAPMGLSLHRGGGELLFQREEITDERLEAGQPLATRIYALLLAGGKSAPQLAKALDEPGNKIRSVLNRMQKGQYVQRLDRSDIWVPVAHHQPPGALQSATGATPTATVAPTSGARNEEDEQWGIE